MIRGFVNLAGISQRVVLVQRTTLDGRLKEESWKGDGKIEKWGLNSFSIRTKKEVIVLFKDIIGTVLVVKMKTGDEGAVVVYRQAGGDFRAEVITPEDEKMNREMIKAMGHATGRHTLQVFAVHGGVAIDDEQS